MLSNGIALLSQLVGVSGYEKSVSNYIKKVIASNLVQEDNIGNLIYKIPGRYHDKKIMVISHMDEVGFQVMRLDKQGHAELKPIGNIKSWNAFNQRITTADNLKKGIIYCEDPSLLKEYEFEKLSAVSTFGKFEVGDVLTFESNFIDTGTKWIGKALDNRVSCYVLMEVICENNQYENDVFFVFSTQEEIGMRGAQVAITTLKPNILINIDVSPVGIKNSLELEDGVGIKWSDSIGISNQDLVRKFELIAQENKIVFQREVSDCGTTEMILNTEDNYGARKIGLSIPCKNIHSALTMVCKHDVEACKKLLKEVLMQGVYLNY